MINIEDVQSGTDYIVGYRSHRWSSRFVRWEIDSHSWSDTPAPRMLWRDHETGEPGEWEAYMHKGAMCVGSSADRLKVYGLAHPHEQPAE